jgi:hypothetical protein
MKKWYADNTELSTTKTKNNVLIFGGIVIDETEERKLKIIIEDIKEKYALRTSPIKWNFKDLKPTYQECSKLEEYEVLLSHSSEWRREIFEKSLEVNYKVILACTERYPSNKPLSIIKEDLTSIVFTQSLTRVGYYVKKLLNEDSFQVILDWPDSSNPKPFNREYYKAYHDGKSCTNNPYYSGPLKELGFGDSILFSKSSHCTMLQFADLVIGASKDYILKNLHNVEYSLGFELTDLIKCKIHGYPNKIIDYGFNYAPKGETYNLIKYSFNQSRQ